MVLFVDLEDENAEPPEIVSPLWVRNRGLRTANIRTLDGEDARRVNPNKNTITEALGCYPYVPLLTPSDLRYYAIFALYKTNSILFAGLLRR